MSVRLIEAQAAMEKLIGTRQKSCTKATSPAGTRAGVVGDEFKFRTVADFTHDWEYWLDRISSLYGCPLRRAHDRVSSVEFIADTPSLRRSPIPRTAAVSAHIRGARKRPDPSGFPHHHPLREIR